MLSIDTVAVLGATDSGSACAVLAALAGCAVRLHEPSPAELDRAVDAVRGRLERALASGAITRTERQRVLDGVLFTRDLEEAATAADLLVDAADARGAVRRVPLGELLRATTAVAAAGAALASELARGLPQPGRVLTLRVTDAQGPAPRLEIAAGPSTVSHVLDRAERFAARVNQAVRVPAR
jgi:3-hydroxyacyl-CoA dehydrogenase